MAIPLTTLDQSFDQWRQNTNQVANNIGDLASVYSTVGGGESTAVTPPATVLDALNDLNSRKLNVGSGGVVSDMSVTTLTISGSIVFNGNTIRILSTSLSNTNANQTLVSLGSKTSVRAGKITIRAQSSTDYQVSELMFLHNGTDIQLTEISILAMNSLVSTFTATIDGSNNLIIQATPQVNNTTYEIMIQPLK